MFSLLPTTVSAKGKQTKLYNVSVSTQVNHPQGRCGHTLTVTSDTTALLFGGITVSLDASGITVDIDNNFYELNSDTNVWSIVKLPLPTARAFHSATPFTFKEKHAIIYIGGAKYENGKRVGALPLSDLFVVMFEGGMYTIESFNIALPQEIAISYHTATLLDDKNILVFGGFQNDMELVRSANDKTASSKLHAINLDGNSECISQEFGDDFATVGHSFVKICDDSFLIMGGSQKAYFMYTKKSLLPEPCEFENCKIEKSPVLNPIPWIKCDGACKKWLHQFCMDLDTLPKGKWFCRLCKKKK